MTSCTFDIIIITAPTKQTASQYEDQFHLLRTKKQRASPDMDKPGQKNDNAESSSAGIRGLYDSSIIHCVADPVQKRVGSGGGTLNALDYLLSIYGYERLSSYKCLLIHSGGESRRAPIHSVCGKAWASVNIDTKDQDFIMNPLLMLIEELSRVFQSNLPSNSLVVACCDVMVNIYQMNQHMIVPRDTISIISVPVDVNIAKNHVRFVSIK